MTKIPEPRDALGNVLQKDDFVVIHFNQVPIFKVIAIESGGLHTAQGITPALVRVVCDITLRQMPGLPFGTLGKLVNPGNQQLIETIAGSLPKS